MLLPDMVELWWGYDLLFPEVPGKVFSRAGYRVLVPRTAIESAQSEFRKGAMDLAFTAHRAYTENGETEYRLEDYRVID